MRAVLLQFSFELKVALVPSIFDDQHSAYIVFFFRVSFTGFRLPNYVENGQNASSVEPKGN